MGKLSELKVVGSQISDHVIIIEEEDAEMPISPGWTRWQEPDLSEVVEDFVDSTFNLILAEADLPDPAAPSPSNQAALYGDKGSDSFLDERVEEDPFPTAGQVIRMERSLHKRWRLLFGHEDSDGDAAMSDAGSSGLEFSPFASEVDWRVASWVVQEGIGHKSLDWLLAIPGVSLFILYAFHFGLCLLYRWLIALACHGIMCTSSTRLLMASLLAQNGTLNCYGINPTQRLNTSFTTVTP